MMSFSGEIKKELAAHIPGARHCRLAELAAVISFAGKLSGAGETLQLKIETGNPRLKEKFHRLADLLFSAEKLSPEEFSSKEFSSEEFSSKEFSSEEFSAKEFSAKEFSPEEFSSKEFSSKEFSPEEFSSEKSEDGIKGSAALRVLESVKMWDGFQKSFGSMETVNELLILQPCCRRAFIRGAFLSSGSMSDPGKAYHFEIVCRMKQQAVQLKHIISSFGVDAKIIMRKSSQVVYVKEGEYIVDLLNIMEAHEALMDLENVRIVKEMRNSVNRKVNCETANISKTVSASVRQIEDIEYIKNSRGLESLPDRLREAASLRLEYPDLPLQELGRFFNPPVGKSGANHRFRKLSEIAAEIKGGSPCRKAGAAKERKGAAFS